MSDEPKTTETETTESPDDAAPSLWQRLRAKRSTRWAMDIAIVVAVVLAISAFQSRHLLSGDDPLPPVQVQGLDGSTLDLEDLDARRTVVYFWTTWCSACDLQSGAISRLHDPDNDDLNVISVALHYDSPAEIEEFVDDEEIDFPVYLGTDATAAAFNVSSFPTIYIIDDDQHIRHGLVGYTTRLGIWTRLWL